MTVSPIRVLYEDGYLIVFDKPSGLLVIPSPHQGQQSMIDLVNSIRCHPAKRSVAFRHVQYLPVVQGTGKWPSAARALDNSGNQDPAGVSVRLYPCHRLDRETSGVIIFAKGKKNQQSMMREFQKQRVDKTYIAFVRGEIKNPQGVINKPIFDYHQRKFRRHLKALTAVTRYRLKDIRRGFSVVEIFPETGRTNQIRIHFKSIGHPLLGERLYAFGKDFPIKFRRLALHAAEIRFSHPVLKKTVTVISPLPKDMADFLHQHERRPHAR